MQVLTSASRASQTIQGLYRYFALARDTLVSTGPQGPLVGECTLLVLDAPKVQSSDTKFSNFVMHLQIFLQIKDLYLYRCTYVQSARAK